MSMQFSDLNWTRRRYSVLIWPIDPFSHYLYLSVRMHGVCLSIFYTLATRLPNSVPRLRMDGYVGKSCIGANGHSLPFLNLQGDRILGFWCHKLGGSAVGVRSSAASILVHRIRNVLFLSLWDTPFHLEVIWPI